MTVGLCILAKMPYFVAAHVTRLISCWGGGGGGSIALVCSPSSNVSTNSKNSLVSTKESILESIKGKSSSVLDLLACESTFNSVVVVSSMSEESSLNIGKVNSHHQELNAHLFLLNHLNQIQHQELD